MERVSRRGYTQSTLSMQSVGTNPATSSPLPPNVEQRLGPILEQVVQSSRKLKILFNASPKESPSAYICIS